MKLPINDTYRITSDKYNWTIQKARIRRNKTTWEGYQYFGSLEACVNGLCELMVMESDARTLAEALAEVKRISTTLTQALAPRFKLVPDGDKHER